MDIKILDTLFRKVPSEAVLEQMRNQHNVDDFCVSEGGKSWFRRFAGRNFEGFSEDEQTLIFTDVLQRTKQWKNRIGKEGIPAFCGSHVSFPEFALSTIGMLSDSMLRLCGPEPCCKINEVLNWREAFLRLGQDLFVCAFLAKEDVKARCSRTRFAWPAAIRTDSVPLNELLGRGLAENHQHLFGSSQTFALTWMDLMNFPEDHEQISGQIQLLRQPVSVDRDDAVLLPLREKVRLACLIRLYLFWGEEGIRERGTVSHILERELRNYPAMTTLKTDISYTRSFWGAAVPQRDGSTCVLDYALTGEVFKASEQEHYRALCGERAFLYHCFRSFYEGRMDLTMMWSFYLYILLKLQFRGELIQVNSRVGFENFAIYQGRKRALNRRLSGYEAELIRMALVAPRKQEHVVSLETRISPAVTARKNQKQIMEWIEGLRRFAEFGRETDRRGDFEEDPANAAEVFYVLHFTKSKDEDLGKETPVLSSYRHRKKRKAVRKQALALAEALSTYEELGCKVRGIDSASNEIGCPPEVFANAFRFLRNFREADYQNRFSVPAGKQKRLLATYHVGEDFLDIASALRAIDETVAFLELERGDRIGHALGLGVWPSIHYKLKKYRVFLRKQDRLDDLVWLLYRGQELGVRIDPEVGSRLKKEAERLLMEIYQPVFEAERWTVNLTDYHCIMQLRGDDPACYRTGRFVPPSIMESQYEEYAISYRDEARNAYRENCGFARFYYHYHYNHAVRQNGNAVCSVEIDQGYMDLIRQIQDKLQIFLQEKGIIVECNPSSNVLIGTFRNYKNHPIFRLHRMGISGDSGQPEGNGDMQVCVNTDDLGVFDTSLEFEYALLYQALREQRKPDGSRCFREEEILQYLEHLRVMGHWASFQRQNE